MLSKTSPKYRYWTQRIFKLAALLALMVVLTAAPSKCLAQITVSAANDDVPVRHVNVARDTVEMVQTDMEKEFSLTLSGDVTIELNAGKNPNAKKTHGTARKGHISIWLEDSDEPFKVAFLVAHELTHQYQMELVGERTLDRNMWFTEGMADVIGASTANYFGKDKFKAFAQSAYNKVSGRYVSLTACERRTDWFNMYDKGAPVYAKADVAMMYLTSQHSPLLMWSYLYKLRDTNDTSKALQKTYGIGTRELERIIG